MVKLAHQSTTQAVDPTDIANKRFVEQLGGRGAPDYMMAKMGSDQDVGASPSNVTINFDTVESSRGITVASNKFRLKAGRTYAIDAAFRFFSYTNVTDFIIVQIFDDTNSVVLGRNGYGYPMDSSAKHGDKPSLSYVFTPETDVDILFRVSAGSSNVNIQAVTSHARIMEITGNGGSGPLEHIETKIHSGSAVQSLTFDGLNGEEDGTYLMEIYWVPPATSVVNLEIRPNGVSTGQNTVWNYGINTSGSTNESSSLLVARTDSTTNLSIYSFAKLTAKTNEYKMLLAEESIHTSAGNASRRGISGIWNDNSTTITSLEFRATNASGILAGTRISLYRMRPENSSVPTRRVAPDSNDQLVYVFNETSGNIINQGSAGSADLTTTNSPTYNKVGIFDRSMLFLDTGRTYAAGAGTIEPAFPITVSCWVQPRFEHADWKTFIGKHYHSGNTWSTPFTAVHLFGNQTDMKLYAAVTVTGPNRRELTAGNGYMVPGAWNHVGLSYDGTNIKLYLNGNLIQTFAETAAIDYGASNGLWMVGAAQPTGSASGEEANAYISDVRIASVARDAAWFENVWRKGLNLT